MDPEEVQLVKEYLAQGITPQELLDAGYSEAVVQAAMGASTQSTRSSSYGSSTMGPFPAEASGVPQWKVQEYNLAQQEYNDALAQLNGYEPDYANDPFNDRLATARDRFSKAATNLNNVRSSMNDFVAKPQQPGQGNYRVGNTEYKYDEQGNPKEVYTYPTQTAQRAPLYPWEEQEGQLRVQKLQQDLAGEGTPWQKANLAYQQQQDVMARQRQMQQDAWARANDISDTRMKAAPMAQIPGQEYFLGYEPGGIWSKVAQSQGANYDPERFRVPIVNINPQDEYEKQLAWQRANGGG